jgi:hypothetical protein
MHPTLSPLSARLATHIVDIPTLPMTVSPVLFAKAPLFWPPDSTVLFRTRISPMHAIGSPCIHTAPVDVDAWLTHAVSHVGRWPTSARRASRLIRCASFMGFSASAWRGRVAGVARTLATVTLHASCLHKLHQNGSVPCKSEDPAVRVVADIDTPRSMLLEQGPTFGW